MSRSRIRKEDKHFEFSELLLDLEKWRDQSFRCGFLLLVGCGVAYVSSVTMGFVQDCFSPPVGHTLTQQSHILGDICFSFFNQYLFLVFVTHV